MDVVIDVLKPYIVPGIILILGYFYNHFAVHIPAEMRKYAQPFADAAVAYVEQKYGGKSNEEKKAIAMNSAKNFFKDFKLPSPSDTVLSEIIEAAVNALDKPVPPIAPPGPNPQRRPGL